MEGIFDKAVKKAMEKFKISKKKAISHLLVFMCGYGSIDDFKDFINYLIKNQEDWGEK